LKLFQEKGFDPRDYILEVTVFLTGAVIMIYELVGSRVLGPFFGTSLFVWTGLIGIILGSLSVGYYLGGIAADKDARESKLSIIILFAALCIGITTATKDLLLRFFQGNFTDVRLMSLLSSVILFSPASVLLGMVSPYVAKIKLSKSENTGATVGSLYAISTAGSITGTFLAGFFLIPYFGTNNLLVLLALALVAISILVSFKSFKKIKLIMLLVFLTGLAVVGRMNSAKFEQGFIDVDSLYGRIWIYETEQEDIKGKIRTMIIDSEMNSAMYLNSDDLVFEYTKYYDLAAHFNSDIDRGVMFGGAGYSYPKHFLDNFPEARLDVVEIDPVVTELAKKYFRLESNPRLSIYHQDGRVFLNNAAMGKYDVIFGDAFGSHYSIPYQLTTLEAVQKKHDILKDDGVVVLNIISAIKGEKGEFLRAEYATYQKVFPQVYLFPVDDHTDGETLQNIMLVALKSESKPDFTSANQEINGFLSHKWDEEVEKDKPILTDDKAPVDFYINKAL
jgi:spermidine synthase